MAIAAAAARRAHHLGQVGSRTPMGAGLRRLEEWAASWGGLAEGCRTAGDQERAEVAEQTAAWWRNVAAVARGWAARQGIYPR